MESRSHSCERRDTGCCAVFVRTSATARVRSRFRSDARVARSFAPEAASPEEEVMRKAFSLLSLLAIVSVAQAQTPQPLALSLGDAARLAAEQSAPSLTAELRTREAEARVAER